MKTDWALVRTMMEAAIGACEAVEQLEGNEAHRDLKVSSDGGSATVFDVLTSAWTYPENLRCDIIRERHVANADLKYVPETARLLVSMAAACAELVGAAHARPADRALRQSVSWYAEFALPTLRRAFENAPTVLQPSKPDRPAM